MVVRGCPPSAQRSYDVSITFDKYYRTPRLWLVGYGGGGQPLRPEEVFEDVLSDYKSKTVTVDPHPHTGLPSASLHPCRHAEMMRASVQQQLARGLTPRADLYLFNFLRFLSGVVPTIGFDFTTDIE